MEQAKLAGQRLLRKGVRRVLVTMGAKGCLMVRFGETGKVESVQVEGVHSEKVVDTVGAGDSFLGAFAHFVNSGESDEDAMKHANMVAARSVESKGTQSSYVYAKDL